MLLFDAAPLISLVGGEPGAPAVAALLRTGDVAIPAPNLAEAIDSLSRRRRLPEAALRSVLDPLLGSSLTVVETTQALAWQGGLLRARHYHRSQRPLSIPDCIVLASAGDDDAIVTSDRALIAAARDDGIAVHPVPDSRGELPQ